MNEVLRAGASRRTINPKIGTMKIGGRLFGEPIQAIESDLTATAVVLEAGDQKVVVVATDLCTVSSFISNEIRADLANNLGIPRAHVLLNESHNHSAPALPGYYPDDYGVEFRDEYYRFLRQQILDAVHEAEARLQPARIGVGWGDSEIGVYRRERQGDRYVLGEVPDHPIDSSVGVLRIDDVEGAPILTAFRYSAHPVTIGGRSAVASSDFPGPARDVVERQLGGLAMFLQGCGGNINPRVGIGYEIDCRDTKNRVGLELGGEALRIAAAIRTNTRVGTRRPLGNIPNILLTSWAPVKSAACFYLGGLETTIELEYGELPGLPEARGMARERRLTYEALREANAPEWQIRVAAKQARWARDVVSAVEAGGARFELSLNAIRVNDVVVVGMNVETFFETGMAIRDAAPTPNTFVLGYTNGSMAYLPREADYPTGGWKLDGVYAVPDLLPQFYPFQLVALRPDAEQRAREAAIGLVEQIAGDLRRDTTAAPAA